MNFVILSLFRRNPFSYQSPQHLLAHGYRRAATAAVWDREEEPGALASSIPGITKQYPNHNVLILKQTPWAEIPSLLGNHGEEIMMRLLFDCGIFACVDRQKGVYYQISGKPSEIQMNTGSMFILNTGVPLSVLEPLDPKLPELDSKDPRLTKDASRPGKVPSIKPESKTGITNGKPVFHKPNSIIFVRRRMLYARPTRDAKANIGFGLAPSRKRKLIHLVCYKGDF